MIPMIAEDLQIKRLAQRLASHTGTAHVGGVWGSSARMVTALCIPQTTPVVLFITAHLEQADHARDDLELFLGRPCEFFPAFETLPGESGSSGEIDAERMKICSLLRDERVGRSTDAPPTIIVAPILALMQPVPTADILEANTVGVCSTSENQGAAAESPESLLSWAVERDYERLPLVESPGDIAMRGDILDWFVRGESSPFRIQFDGDRVESIRRFDVSTQRSIESLTSIRVTATAATSKAPTPAEATDLLDYLPDIALICLDEPSETQTLGDTLHKRMQDTNQLFSVNEVLQHIHAFPQLHLTSFGESALEEESIFQMGVVSVSRFENQAAAAVEDLARLSHDHNIHVICDADGEIQRLTEMLPELSSQSITLHRGVMHRGFEWTASKTIVVGHHEIFHRQRLRRRVRKIHASRPLDSWLDLSRGDLVVHVVHGIAAYRGLKKMKKGNSNQQEEFLSLEFADKAMVYVPCSQVDLVQKYIGMAGRKPELSKLGGKRWAKTKEQVQDAVSDLAESLLRVQATRDSAIGTAYPADTEWQREFEASFPYEETEDQLVIAGDIRADLQRPRPMDRLVCGDVGYGKTELAMRAAFKVVEYGKQVAVLVPTTVLAEQHYRTFRERMAEYPFVIECLSRFRTTKEQKKIVDDLKKGRIDIVIGTHRLVSKDVSFADLGLVVIDEEQRFGVEHKERLKDMRETVDVLTLTATPIPRTLHMALMGLRDISSLQTPPVDRRSIHTQVRPFSRDLIRDAILRELNRDGQVFFVHNFVNSIAAMADTISSIVPEAEVLFGHGQMKEGELERVMRRFIRREAQVLVCTTIIESGIDMPSVNTIFINRGERFGLADLHQLRGRVGRSDHRAYCYLLLSPKHPPNAKAAKRLKTIEEFSELGAGFRIAMRDLEIRGAGNILGKEQSGHIAAVGYEMYCRLVEQTVRRLKDEPDPTPPPVHIDLDVAAHIPRNYATADRSRIELYRRIAAAMTEKDIAQVQSDLVDAFGPYPTEVDRLIELARLRIMARSFTIRSISLRPPDIVFSIGEMAKAEPVFRNAAGSVRMPDNKTIYWRPPINYLEKSTLLPMLRRMLTRAAANTEITV